MCIYIWSLLRIWLERRKIGFHDISKIRHVKWFPLHLNKALVVGGPSSNASSTSFLREPSRNGNSLLMKSIFEYACNVMSWCIQAVTKFIKYYAKINRNDVSNQVWIWIIGTKSREASRKFQPNSDEKYIRMTYIFISAI